MLRPYTFISNLKLWDFYTEETLSEAPSYDWELRGRQERAEEVADKPDTSAPVTQRRIVWPCYDNLSKVMPDAISKLLQDLQSLEAELGQTAERWKDTWDKIKMTQRTDAKPESKVRRRLLFPPRQWNPEPADSGLSSTAVLLQLPANGVQPEPPTPLSGSLPAGERRWAFP